MIPRVLLLLSLLCASAAAAAAQSIDVDRVAARLAPLIERAMLEGRIPSAAVALVSGERIVWAEGRGHANVWARTPAVPSTVYLIGSTFKAMSTFALLQQMEKGRFKLDDRVNDHLDRFKIRGELPSAPITFRHLLTHTSGLPAAFGAHPVWGYTVPAPLETYLRESLVVRRAPLEKLEYSNLAFTLVGYLVEKLSGTTFREYMEREIFAPLEMSSTAFAPRPDMDERLAVPYVVDEKSGRLAPAPRVKADVWPAGIVYGTVLDQARWLICNLNGGVYNGRRLLSQETVAQMHTRQYDRFTGPMEYGFGNETTGYGLTWITSRRGGERLIFHSGSVAGYTAFLLGNLDRRIGFAILTNGNRAHRHIAHLAEAALDLMAETPQAGR